MTQNIMQSGKSSENQSSDREGSELLRVSPDECPDQRGRFVKGLGKMYKTDKFSKELKKDREQP